ncbi:MAG: DNA-processing protein DprA [Candidatus Hydrothermales bacterium]
MDLERIVAISLIKNFNLQEKNNLEEIIIEDEKLEKSRKIIEKCYKLGINILTKLDKNYPQELKSIFNSPLVIYYKGNLEVLKSRKVGIVGTRKPTKYGRDVAFEFSKALSKRKISIVSGGARGIDTVAHIAALEAGGTTICVLGCGLDIVYPPENKKIFKEIEKKGILITEHPPGTRPFSYNFPLRNRIIAALSEVIIVVEAGEKSGTFITVKWALDMGKDVFAIPGEIYSPKSKGPNFLIKQGAHLATDPLDILEHLGIEEKLFKEEVKLESEERKIFNYLKEKGKKNIDEIREDLKIEIAELISLLINLEIKGIIRNDGGGFYSIK